MLIDAYVEYALLEAKFKAYFRCFRDNYFDVRNNERGRLSKKGMRVLHCKQYWLKEKALETLLACEKKMLNVAIQTISKFFFERPRPHTNKSILR